ACQAMRRVRARVLPPPAPARTARGAARGVNAWRWGSPSPSSNRASGTRGPYRSTPTGTAERWPRTRKDPRQSSPRRSSRLLGASPFGLRLRRLPGGRGALSAVVPVPGAGVIRRSVTDRFLGPVIRRLPFRHHQCRALVTGTGEPTTAIARRQGATFI